MRIFALSLTLIALLLWILIAGQAQSPPNQTPPATGSITGRVTINGQPASGIVVALQPPFMTQRHPLAEAVTDIEGRYQLTGIAAGEYNVLPLAPTLTVPDANDLRSPPRIIRLNDGAAIKDFDFALVRGGVITGRVMDANGKPVIRESLTLLWIDGRGEKQRYFSRITGVTMFNTDDRGQYRFYGLPAGRYLLSVGKTVENYFAFDNSGTYYPLTFYPNATEEAQAKIIELKSGGEAANEAANIDITVGRLVQSHTVAGRIVDGATGQPIPNAQFTVTPVKSDGQFTRPISASLTTDPQGKFRQPGLLPGRYALTLSAPETGYYSESVKVSVADQDVADLEIKARRGATLSGTLTLEGDAPPAVLALLRQLQISISQQLPDTPPVSRLVTVNRDGNFNVKGLLPGKVRMDVYSALKQDFRLLRAERSDGKSATTSFDLAPGEQITGLRLVVSYLIGAVRGKVEINGGPLPAGVRLRVAVSPNSPANLLPFPSTVEVGTRLVEVSASGDFVIENLKAGGYSLILRPVPAPDAADSASRVPTTGQNIFVTGGAETKVTLVLDLRAKEGKQ